MGLPAIGEIIDGLFKIERKLGSGATGTVFEVQLSVPWTSFRAGERFCLKWYAPAIFEREEARIIIARRIRESMVGSYLAHPNLVKVHDTAAFWKDGLPRYVVMSLITGETLESLTSRGPVPTDLARNLLLGTANGLKALHDHGILHRDVKSANVMRRQWRPSGVARPGRRATSERSDRYQFTEFLGNSSVRSTEWLFREECSTSSDVYSLGTIGYQLLTGQPIFSDIGLYSRLVMAVRNQPIEIEDSGWSPERRYLGNVVRRMLAKEPESRPSLDVVIECLSNYRRRDAWSWLERNGIFRKLGSDLGSDSPRQRRFVQAVLELYGEETLRRLMRENHTDQVVSDPRLRRMFYLMSTGEAVKDYLSTPAEEAQGVG